MVQLLGGTGGTAAERDPWYSCRAGLVVQLPGGGLVVQLPGRDWWCSCREGDWWYSCREGTGGAAVGRGTGGAAAGQLAVRSIMVPVRQSLVICLWRAAALTDETTTEAYLDPLNG